MAFPLSFLPIVGQIADTIGQTRSNKKANESNERLAREQQAWNEKMWAKNNAYNDPSAQMARLKDAGLNPRLIYGQSSGAAAGNASEVKGYDRAESKSVYNGTTAFADMVNFKNTETQTDNLKSMEEVNKQEALVKAQEVLNKTLDVDRKGFDLGVSKELRETSLQAARANAEQQMQNAIKSGAEAKVSVNTSDQRIKQAEIEVKKAISQLKGQDLENELKKLSLNLRQNGIIDSDPIIWRLVIQNWEKIKKWGNSPFPDSPFKK